MYKKSIESALQQIDEIKSVKVRGFVKSIRGIVIECIGITNFVSIGVLCRIIKSSDKSSIMSEVVGFDKDIVLLMPYGNTDGVGAEDYVEVCNTAASVLPDLSWRGRIINALAEPIDDKGGLKKGDIEYFLKSSPPNAQKRGVLGSKIELGVRSIDTFTSCCYGQRMGIFAGSGVGKSVLISMFTKYAKADVKIIGLVGERGREVNEFINEYLGEEGLKDAVIVVATGDEPALVRKRAAYLTMTIAEYFRDQGMEVLCIIDSVTRFAMAMREIGLAVGEPPTSKGYTPSVFSELPKLLERAGPGVDSVAITGLFTVLVEGDDQNEPVSDAVRSILDGHIVLDRAIAERGRYPAIDVLKSVSRAMPKCNTPFETRLVNYAKKTLSLYSDMAEMIRIGAYKKGTDPETDVAIKHYNILEEFFTQAPNEHSSISNSYERLSKILGIYEKS